MRRSLGVIAALAAGCSNAFAANVSFSGTVTSVCSILATTGGTLGISTNGGEMSSLGTLGGLAGSATILSIGSNTIQVTAPTLTAQPGGYDATNQSLEVKYAGIDTGLSAVDQDWTTSTTTFDPPAAISASVLGVNTRVVNPDGFVEGTYTTQTTITCTP